MKCYRVWFSDGTALLVDANNKDEAINKAERITKGQGHSEIVESVECLD